MASTTMTTSAPVRKHVPSSSVSYSAFPSPPGPSSRPASISSRPRRHTHSASDTSNITLGQARSSNNLLAKYSVGLEDTFLGEVDDKPRQSSITALADFLKNHQPPASNYMSTPDVFEDEKERGRWAKWKKIGRRSSSAPRYPQQIILPDSAVSGITIGGFRHIAISIPLEASPFGHIDMSQDPTYSKPDGKAGAGKNPPIRTYLNEKGVVTVLRTVTEDREAGPIIPQFTQKKTKADGVPKRRSKSRLSTESSISKRDSLDSRKGTSRPSSARTFDRSLYPVRGSSIGNNTRHQPQTSIDGVIAPMMPYQQPPTKIIAMNDEDLLITEAQLGEFIAAPPAKSERRHFKPPPLGLSDRPLTAETDNDLPGTPGSTRSRKDVVRDRKKRDIEAMRAKQSKSQDEDRPTSLDMMIAPIRIVVDMEPTDEIFITPNQTPDSIRPVSDGVPPLDLGESLTTAHLRRENSSHERPFTPNSPRYDDRTSLSRRREWNNSRQARQQSGEGKEAREAARLRAKRLLAAALSPNEDESATSQADKEILRLYEAYRDHRLREMERRVRRLERNGDVWLRALVPVLNNLNQSFNVQQQPRHDTTVSDNEDYPARESRKREIGAQTPDKRSTSASQGRSHERITTKAYESDIITGLLSGSEDESGLSGIEPLMRELAGEAKRRQRRAMAARAAREDIYGRS